MAVLGSGSGGNATVIQFEDEYLLIDVGLSAKQIRLRLESLAVPLEAIAGILLTHEHGDHTRGLKVLLKQIDVPVYANAMTRECVQAKAGDKVKWKIFQSHLEGCSRSVS